MSGSIVINFDGYNNPHLEEILELAIKIPEHFRRIESLNEVQIEGDKVTFIAYGHHTFRETYHYKDGKLV